MGSIRWRPVSDRWSLGLCRQECINIQKIQEGLLICRELPKASESCWPWRFWHQIFRRNFVTPLVTWKKCFAKSRDSIIFHHIPSFSRALSKTKSFDLIKKRFGVSFAWPLEGPMVIPSSPSLHGFSWQSWLVPRWSLGSSGDEFPEVDVICDIKLPALICFESSDLSLKYLKSTNSLLGLDGLEEAGTWSQWID